MPSLIAGRRQTLTRGLALAAVASTPGRRAAAQPGAPIRIGVLTDQSGPYADSGGRGSVLAAHLAVAEFGGSVLGRRIEVIDGDTLNKPDVAAGIARRWFDDGVDAIVDLPVTSVAAAVQQIAHEKNRSVMITSGAATEFTTKSCSSTSTHWADDTHALAVGAALPLVRAGAKTWFFISVDYAFGVALQRDAAAQIEQNGGQVIGSTRFPIGNADFSSMLLQAEASGAKVIGLAAVGSDLVNLVKQAGEFGLTRPGGPALAGFLVYITEVHALGLAAAQGFTFPSGFYWNQSAVARTWSRQFFTAHKAMPTRVHAAVYSATLHWLRAIRQAGTTKADATGRAMRALPVDYLGRPASVREDGRVIYDLPIYRVKRPSESAELWDYYEHIDTISAREAFLPLLAQCHS